MPIRFLATCVRIRAAIGRFLSAADRRDRRHGRRVPGRLGVVRHPHRRPGAHPGRRGRNRHGLLPARATAMER
jgi:hypothetical protein